MKRFYKLIGIVLSLTMITLITGCGGSSSSTPATSDSTGILSLSITDKPLLDENVTAVNIKVIDIEYHHNGEWTEVKDVDGNDFVPQAFNLLDLQNGKSLPLGDFELPAGHYTQIRFMLDIPNQGENPKNNPGCNITIEEDGVSETKPLFVPSGGQSGYKGIGEFEIIADANVSITADWDADRSIVHAGDKYILKPVIRLVVTELSGWINGTVVDVAKYVDPYSLVVYAYEDGNYTDNPSYEDTNSFPNAVTSGEVNMDDGNFTLSFLGAGSYELVTAQYDGATLIEVVDVEEVVVSTAVGISVDLNTSDDTP